MAGNFSATLDDRGMPVDYNFNAEWEATPRETKRGMEDASILLIDCRRADEYALCRIEGATLAPLDDLGTLVEDLREEAAGRPVVVHCHTGRRSLRAAAFLRAQGFEDVKSMAGGIELWSMDIDPSVARY
jgi:rhodanese-related sulfurtransferase